MPDAIVFIGPSLSIEQRPKLAGLRYLPPIRRGDLRMYCSSVEKSNGCVIGIVDGVFDQFLAISPREIINALKAGCTVLGSSSMGALRAVELSSYGMQGVGKIYEMYRSGEVITEDEVAIIFDGETNRSFVEPLVNIRCAVTEAVIAGILKPIHGNAIINAAVETPYWLRNYSVILKRAGELLGGVDLQFVFNKLQQINQKERDALLLLDTIATSLTKRG